MQIRHRKRSAWTLIEMVVVMLCLAILLSLLVPVVWAVFRIQASAMESFEQMQAEATLADRFREDVAGSNDVPELAADYEGEPICLIAKGDDFIIYQFRDGVLNRMVPAGKKNKKPPELLPAA